MQEEVYLFIGNEAKFPSGVFTTIENAKQWIEKYSLSGILNKYPLDEGLYDWAIKKDFFTAKNEHQKEAKFIQRFTSASMDHWHFENGQQV
ncbi:MAG: DUF7710 domain-containing protein [Chryseobacterium jejuense]|uniref:DUF7710 domain-containing protein n=1 Tax=Chryseobacterium jejuense TaxID=445960 RepID=UPI003D0ACB2F